MAVQDVLSAIHSRLKSLEKTRILAFGSSNTERRSPGMHWLDVLDLAIKRRYGRIHHCINTGIGGNTSRDLLARFEDDAAFYRPHVAIVTIGGNDSNPAKSLGEEEFVGNLRELRNRFHHMGCAVVFQTYYAPDPARNEDLSGFYAYMDIVRNIAAESAAGLVDHLRRWELFRKAFPDRYLPLMEDGFHLNCRGNMILGLDLSRSLGVEFDLPEPEFWSESLEMQRLMDSLDQGGKA